MYRTGVDCCVWGLYWTQVFGKHQSLYGFIAMGKDEITEGACSEGKKNYLALKIPILEGRKAT